MTEVKVNTSWAFSSNAEELSAENRKSLDILLNRIGGSNSYKITKKPQHLNFFYKITALTEEAKKMTAREAALLADNGNLCFGGRDFRSDSNGNFYGIVHED